VKSVIEFEKLDLFLKDILHKAYASEIMLPSTPRSSEWLVSFMLQNQSFVQMHATGLAHLAFLYLITLIMFGEE
jgi:hypothetical protein